MTFAALGTCALGRATDACGFPLDGLPPLRGPAGNVEPCVPPPNERSPVDRPLWTGVRAIDGLLTIGRGARIGIFGAPGAGKSTLIESIVSGCAADVVVVGLIGERGREAQRWLDRCDRRTIVVCATSDRPAAERVRAAYLALAQAGALRRRGLHVLLVLDSLARLAAAFREGAVAAGESTGRGGYPPSVFASLARVVESAGAVAGGSVTLFASVLSDGDERDPVSDAARSLLDGHIALSERLAGAAHYPAIDVLSSASRTMAEVVDGTHAAAASHVRRALAALERTADARALGIEAHDPETVAAVGAQARIEAFLRQPPQPASPRETLAMLAALADTLEGSHEH
jgi:type III secretion protein N (ATPase)